MGRKLARILAAVIGIFCAISTWETHYWKDSVTLFQHAMAVAGESERMHIEMADAESANGNLEGAIAQTQAALRLEPKRWSSHYTLAMLLSHSGGDSEVLAHLAAVVTLRPDHVAARKQLALSYMRNGNLLAAAGQLQRVLQQTPDDTQARNLLSNLPPPPQDIDADHPPEASFPEAAAPFASDQLLQNDYFWELLTLAGILAAAYMAPRLWAPLTGRTLPWLNSLARRPVACAVAIAVFPLVVRALLLPAFPAPVSTIADEFGHLLNGKTYALARLANPPSPFWRHFEANYVLQKPTYAAQYPPAQGLFLAFPLVLGASPWLGVWLTVALMGAALYWMLRAWLPPGWALTGATIVVLRIGITTYWLNSLWGGAVPAIGGALAVGALPRILRRIERRDVLALGAGLVVLALSRPFEGFLLSLPIAVILAIWLFRSRQGTLAFRITHVAAPLIAVLALGGLFLAYDNWRVTGNPAELPYQLHRKQYGTPMTSYYEPPPPPPADIQNHPDIARNYRIQLQMHDSANSPAALAEIIWTKAQQFWKFYFQWFLTLPLAFLPAAMMRDRRIVIVTVASLLVLGATWTYIAFFPHYDAPLLGALVVVTIVSMRRMAAFSWRGRRIGRALAKSIVLATVAMTIATLLGPQINPTRTPRTQVEEALGKLNGQHLVIVRLNDPEHRASILLYNGADLEGEKIVWARELDPASNAELIQHYAGRKVWLFEADPAPGKLSDYPR